MAKFKPGHSGNPGGRVKLPDEIKKAKKLNAEGMHRALNKFLSWPIKDLVEYVNNKDNPVLEVLIAKILAEAIKKGDHMRLNFIFDRVIGKVKDQVVIDHKLLESAEEIMDLTEKQQIELLETELKKLKGE